MLYLCLSKGKQLLLNGTRTKKIKINSFHVPVRAVTTLLYVSSSDLSTIMNLCFYSVSVNFSGVSRGGPKWARALPEACCPTNLQDQDTLIQQSVTLIK